MSVPSISNAVALEAYLQKCVGRDMALKSIVYPIRLATLYVGSEKGAILTQLITNIVDCRMLTNQWKAISAYISAYRAAVSKEKMPLMQRILVVFSFLFRSLEQLSGDLGYIRNHLIPQWSRPRISWHYKFWKTMSLTCCAILEMMKLIDLKRKREMARVVAQSPVCTPAKQQKELEFPPPPAPCCEDADEVANAMRWSAVFLFRNICDMIVYFQWIESYRPNKHLEYICGFFSGLIGVYIVWKDIKWPSSKKINA